jgi:hypothetical protein
MFSNYSTPAGGEVLMVARVEAIEARPQAHDISAQSSRVLADEAHSFTEQRSVGGRGTVQPAVLDFSEADPLQKWSAAGYQKVADVIPPPGAADRTSPVSGDAHDRASGTTDGAKDSLTQSRAKLESDIDKVRASNPELARQMSRDMAAFEKRMAGVSNGDAHVDATYKEITKLLESKGGQLTSSSKGQVAADILHAAADPGSVNQGFTNDCALASMESRMYARNPERAAAIVVEASTTGHVRTTLDGKDMALAPSTFWNRQSSEGMDPAVKFRSLGDQIFQTVAYNAELNQLNKADPNRNLRMELAKAHPPYDTGERVYDYSKHPREDVTGSRATAPIIDPATTEAVYNNLARTNESGFSLTFDNANTPNDLRNTLTRAQAEGKLPLIVVASLERDPIKSEFGGESGIQGAMTHGVNYHAITVTGFDPRTGDVHYRSSTDGSQDRTMTLDQFYKVLHPPLREETIPKVISLIQDAMKQGGPEFIKSYLHMLTIQDRQRLLTEYRRATHTDLESELGA